MVAGRHAAIAVFAVATLAAGAARASADALVYRCGPNVCRAAPDGTGNQRLTKDGKPGGPLYSWLSASADGSRLAVVNATYAYVLDGRGRRLTGRLPRSGTGVIAEIAPSGAQVATVDLVPEIAPAPVGSPPGTPGLSGFVPYMFVMNADGSGREATARSVVDIGWLGERLVRTDQSEADPFPYGICVLATNTAFQCGSDVARNPTQDLFNPAFSPDGRLVAVVESPSTTVGAGAIVIYDVATAAPVRELVAGENTQPTWSPNGKRIAFERGGDIYVAHATGAPRMRRVLKGGEQPSWTSAPACKARRARVRVRGRRALVTACVPQPGRLTVTLLRAGRRVARRTVPVGTGGTVTVRLRRPPGASARELRARVSRR
jgi:dipeptidyl aminopeptidase/acylaminoacyl peptidase